MKLSKHFFFSNFFVSFFFSIFGKIYFINKKKTKKYECLYDNIHAKNYYNLHSKSSILAEKYYEKIYGDKKNKYKNSYLKKYAQKILPLLVIDNFFNNNFKDEYLSKKVNFYVFHKNISPKILNDLEKYNVLNFKYKIHFLIKIYLQIIELIKKLYFFSKFFYLEYSLIKFQSIKSFDPNKKISPSGLSTILVFKPLSLPHILISNLTSNL